MEQLISYYDSYNEDKRLKKDNAHKVEFITTTHILDKYMRSNSAILDVGAGTGIYSLYYAQKEHSVKAIDAVPKHVEQIKQKISHNNYRNIDVALGDAVDLSKYKNESFDVVLCMGPIYHLKERVDKIRCLSECLRVLKKGGLLAIAYINRFPAFIRQVSINPEFLNKTTLDKMIKNEAEPLDDDCFDFTSPDEVDTMMSGLNVKRLENAATDGIGYMLSDMINEFDEEKFQLWLDYHLKTCREPSIIGYSMHGLYVCRKI